MKCPHLRQAQLGMPCPYNLRVLFPARIIDLEKKQAQPRLTFGRVLFLSTRGNRICWQ